MDFLKKLLGSWNVSGNKELIAIKKEIASEAEKFSLISTEIDEKVSLLQSLPSSNFISRIKNINSELEILLQSIINNEEKEEKIHLRILLKKAIKLNPRDRPVIIKHLQFVHDQLNAIENKIISLIVKIKAEIKLLDNIKASRVVNLPKIKSSIERFSTQEKRLMDKIIALLNKLKDELNERILMEMFGHETRFKCPKCGMRFVTIEKTQIKEKPRNHQHVFFCHFCDFMENATDVTLLSVQRKWS